MLEQTNWYCLLNVCCYKNNKNLISAVKAVVYMYAMRIPEGMEALHVQGGVEDIMHTNPAN